MRCPECEKEMTLDGIVWRCNACRQWFIQEPPRPMPKGFVWPRGRSA